MTDANSDDLTLIWTQRSVDSTLGLGANIASYAALLHVVAKATGKVPGQLIGMLEDVHLYIDQIEGIEEQLGRVPLELPTLLLAKERGDETAIEYIDSILPEDFKLAGYNPHPAIKFDMAV
jgi:thymidylate synthase